MLPTVTRTAEVVLRLVPGGLREGVARARRHRVAHGAPGRPARPRAPVLLTAVILGSRVSIGETAPLLAHLGRQHVTTTPTRSTGKQDGAAACSSTASSASRSTASIAAGRGPGRSSSSGIVLVLFVVARVLGGRGPGHIGRFNARCDSHERVSHDYPSDTDRARRRGTRSIHGARAAMLTARQVSAWFGEHKVLDRVTLDDAAESGHRAHRSVRLREVDVPADPEPHARARAGRDARGHGRASTASTSTAPDSLVTDVRRRIGMVFQKPNPFPAMTVAENVLSGLKLSRHRRSHGATRDDLVENVPAAAPGCGTR